LLDVFAQAAPTQKELCGYYGDDDKIIYDYDYHFGPLHDQGSTGSCYAFSVAALLEEDNYLRLVGMVPNSLFDNNISVIDIQRCDMETGHGLGYTSGNDYAFFAMECALYDGGACFDKNAGFNTSSKWSFTNQKGRFQDFMKEYDEWIIFKASGNRTKDELLDFINEKTEALWNYLSKDEKAPYTGKGYSFLHFLKAFSDAKNRVHFLNLVLTTDNCKKNRNDFSDRKLYSSNYYQKNYSSNKLYKEEKMNLIKKAFTLKRSSIVILYANSLTHAAVIAGMRMKDGVCQLYLRSSMEDWGRHLVSGWYSDWYDADYILESTLSIKYLQEASKEDYETAKELFLKKDIANAYTQDNLYNDPSKW
jgi:hypothetical protein